MSRAAHQRALALLASVGALASWSPPATARELHVYTALDSLEAQIYVEAFTKDTGIPVRWVRLSAGEVLTRIRTESANPQASVWYGGPSLDFAIAARDGLLDSYHSGSYDRFPPSGHDPDWRWSGVYRGIIGFASNPALLARRGAAPPTSWRDLLRTQYRNDVSMAYAYTSGTSYVVVASLVQLFGEDAALLYLRDLDRNIHHYARSGSACVAQVGLGELGVCVAFSHDILTKGIRKGYPMVLTYPSEGTGSEIGAVAMLRGAPEPEEGRRFVDWTLTARAQALLSSWNRLPIRDDVPAGEGLPRANELKVVELDLRKAAADRDRIIDAWREMTGQ